MTAKQLRTDSAILPTLTQWYRENSGKYNIKTQSFFETKNTSGFMVVPETSADPGINNTSPISIQADHEEICKPQTRNDTLYTNVCIFLRDIFGSSILMPNNRFLYNCTNKNAFERCLDLQLSTTQGTTTKVINLNAAIRCNLRLLEEDENLSYWLGVTSFDLEVETGGCSIQSAYEGLGDTRFSSAADSDQPNIERVSNGCWNVTAGKDSNYLTHLVLGNENLPKITVDNYSECEVNAFARTRVANLKIIVKNDHDNTNEIIPLSENKKNLVSIVLKKSLGKRNNEIILSEAKLEAKDG